MRLNLMAPVLDVVFPIICDFSSDNEEDSEAAADDDDDTQSPSSTALQVDTVVLYSCLTYQSH